MTIERHPLEPFLPPEATILFLGSFPPPRERWSMDFFYPNYINDFWRVTGLVHFGDARHFERPDCKGFDQARIEVFCRERGFAFFDTATVVRRLKDNASDAFLEVTEPTDVGTLLSKMPLCRRIVTTGGKASEAFLGILQGAGVTLSHPPSVGEHLPLEGWGRQLEWWRMPSTSRAYPLPLEKKAAFYKLLF